MVVFFPDFCFVSFCFVAFVFVFIFVFRSLESLPEEFYSGDSVEFCTGSNSLLNSLVLFQKGSGAQSLTGGVQ